MASGLFFGKTNFQGMPSCGILPKPRAIGFILLPAFSLLTACSNCRIHSSQHSRRLLVTDEYSLSTIHTVGYRECPRFLHEPDRFDHPTRTEYRLSDPDGERDITAFYTEYLKDNTGFFTIEGIPHVIHDKVLYRLRLDSLGAERLFPFPYPMRKYQARPFGEQGIAACLNHYNENIDLPLDRFLAKTDPAGIYNVNTMNDSLYYGSLQGNRRISVAAFFGYEYVLYHDVYYWEGRYYGIFQDNESEFILLIKDPGAGRTDTLRVPFPSRRSRVPNIEYRTRGYFAFYDRASGAYESVKYFGKVDPIRKTIAWEKGRYIHVHRGIVTFTDTVEPVAIF